MEQGYPLPALGEPFKLKFTSSLLQPVANIVFWAVRGRFVFISNQILMSVLRIQVHVMKMQTAKTMTVLTAVLVSRDLLEMERFVKVYTMLFSVRETLF